MDQQTFLNIPQAAERLGVDAVTVWRWVRSGKIAVALQINKQALFTIEEVDRIAAERKQEAAEASTAA